MYEQGASRDGPFRPSRSLPTINGTEQVVQTVMCIPATCKCQELHAPSRKTTRTRHAFTYIPGTSFLLLDMHEIESTAARHRTAKAMKNEWKIGIEGKKGPVLSDAIIFFLVETP